MKHASSNLERASRRRLLGSIVTAAVALGAILVSAGPAAADGLGAGTFTGDEHAPNSTLVNPPLPSLCAKFDPALGPNPTPLIEDLDLVGTFTNSTGAVIYAGPATGTFTGNSTPYFANPVGTFSTQARCTAPGAVGGDPVSGTMEIHGTAPLAGSIRCPNTGTAAATYDRRAGVVITIKFTAGVPCAVTSNTGTPGTTVSSKVTFRGVEVPCLTGVLPFDPNPAPCPDPNGSNGATAEAFTAGTYLQDSPL